MQLRAEQLEAQLAQSLAPAYAIHGDEPLLALEAADAVRAAARSRGFTEREVFEPGRHFKWGEFVQAASNLSLFGGQKIVELRLATGKPGAQGGEAIAEFCRRPPPGVLLLVSLPRLDRKSQAAPWFESLRAAGVVVEVWPLDRAKLPEWIGARLARNGQKAGREVLEYLAERVEGNLLAARQEVLKLALLAPPGELALEVVAQAVSNVARYGYDDLADALFAGDTARYLRVLAGLRAEGEAEAALAWRLGDEVVALIQVAQGLAAGEPRESLYARHRVWSTRRRRFDAALARRLDARRLSRSVRCVARAERAAKGVDGANPWDELARLGLEWAHGAEGARKIG
jgi:DNA polymerase-3 subunit delta